MEYIVDILVRRDGISKNEARDRVKYCMERLQNEAVESGDYELATDIIADELGLEPDYMMDLLF